MVEPLEINTLCWYVRKNEGIDVYPVQITRRTFAAPNWIYYADLHAHTIPFYFGNLAGSELFLSQTDAQQVAILNRHELLSNEIQDLRIRFAQIKNKLKTKLAHQRNLLKNPNGTPGITF
jgi:hypothetical protein